MPERTCRVNPLTQGGHPAAPTRRAREGRARLSPEVDVLASTRPGASLVVAMGLLLGACPSVSLHDGLVTTPDTRYRIGPAPAGWEEVALKDSDLSWLSRPRDYALWVDSTCKDYQDVPLVALNRQLLIGFTEVQRQDQRTEQLDGREALVSRYQVKMDGVPRELGLVVLKKDGCIYDFAYVAPPGGYAVHAGEFQALWGGFATENRR